MSFVTSLVVWCAYSAGRSVWLTGDGKVPSPVNGHEAQREADDRARDGHRNIGEMQHVADHYHGSAGECSDGIEVGTQDCRNFGQENVARYAATDSGQHAHERRHDRIEPESERLLRAGYSEKCEPRTVEHEHWRSRSIAVGHQKVIMPAKTETARYRQSLIAAGGTAPISRSRVIPPKLPTTNDNTSTPKMSSRRPTPAVAPLTAKTKVPIKSSTNRSVFIAATGLRLGAKFYTFGDRSEVRYPPTPPPTTLARRRSMFPRPSRV